MRYDTPSNLSDGVTLRRRFELRVRGKKSGKSVKLRQAKNYETGCIRLQFVGCHRLALVTIRGRPVIPPSARYGTLNSYEIRLQGGGGGLAFSRALSSRFRRKFPRQVHSHVRKSPLQSPRRSTDNLILSRLYTALICARNVLEQINLHAVDNKIPLTRNWKLTTKTCII